MIKSINRKVTLKQALSLNDEIVTVWKKLSIFK